MRTLTAALSPAFSQDPHSDKRLPLSSNSRTWMVTMYSAGVSKYVTSPVGKQRLEASRLIVGDIRSIENWILCDKLLVSRTEETCSHGSQNY